MANLSAITGRGLKKRTQFEVSSPTDDGTYQNVDITSAAVSDLTKTKIYPTCIPSIENGTVGFRIEDATTAQYKITAVTVPPAFLTFDIVEEY